MNDLIEIDVLCVGHACYDLTFSVPHHPNENEKIFATGLIGCGGGPAANAAVAVSLLGLKSAFAGYLGRDIYGDKHEQELHDYGVYRDLIVRGDLPTPLSTVLVKPDGQRALINYKADTQPLAAEQLDFSAVCPKVMLFDGHEPYLSMALARQAREKDIPTVLDAGSLHDGTLALLGQVDYVVCSEKFGQQFTGNPEKTLARLARVAPVVVITLGDQGLIWQHGNNTGALPALPVDVVDTTGAGDAFHGAFAAALAFGMDWLETLRYASAAGAYCCTKKGARLGLPTPADLTALLTTT